MMKWKDIDRKYKSELERKKTQSPHELLGVIDTASKREIKSAYMKLVKTYHPDGSDAFMTQYNQEVLKLINSAYEKLSKQNG